MGSGIFRSASSTTTVWRSYFRRFDRLSVRSGRTLLFGHCTSVTALRSLLFGLCSSVSALRSLLFGLCSSVTEPIEVTFGRILPRDFFFQDLSEAVSEPVEVTDGRIDLRSQHRLAGCSSGQ